MALIGVQETALWVSKNSLSWVSRSQESSSVCSKSLAWVSRSQEPSRVSGKPLSWVSRSPQNFAFVGVQEPRVFSVCSKPLYWVCLGV